MEKVISIGKQNFASLRENHYFFVDKSHFIKDWWENGDEITLITRPRRFGKTLNMSMLDCFFSNKYAVRGDLFEGLGVWEEGKYRELQGTYPVIFLSFAAVKADQLSEAKIQIKQQIARVYEENRYLLDGDLLSGNEKKAYNEVNLHMGDAEAAAALNNMSMYLARYYGRRVIILLDEYDMPMQEAYVHGYWAEFTTFVRSLFNATFKTNPYLERAMMTGITRVSKESIFSDLNNLRVVTTTSDLYADCFGFTEKEVFASLDEFGMGDKKDVVKQWYDGYHFGNFDIYCPWDVMNYLRDLQQNPMIRPSSYWKNTSDNAIIRSFIDQSGSSISQKLEKLLSGGYIVQQIDENLTYDYLHSSENNLWSILYLTGYLTRVPDAEIEFALPIGSTALMIPNAEIREIYESTIMQWFNDYARSWDRNNLFQAAWMEDTDTLTAEMNRLLRQTISYHDYREDFYHAFLAGIFAGAGYMVESNREHGEGRSDIVISDLTNSKIIIFEAKYAKSVSTMEADCEKALEQINTRMYAAEYEDDYDQIICYGIAFYKKRCLVKKAE